MMFKDETENRAVAHYVKIRQPLDDALTTVYRVAVAIDAVCDSPDVRLPADLRVRLARAIIDAELAMLDVAARARL